MQNKTLSFIHNIILFVVIFADHYNRQTFDPEELVVQSRNNQVLVTHGILIWIKAVISISKWYPIQ